MDEKKLNSLIMSLLKMAEEQENPSKYNKVIAELTAAEEIKNVTIIDHKGSPVVNYINRRNHNFGFRFMLTLFEFL